MARRQRRDLSVSVFKSSCHLPTCLPHTAETLHCPFNCWTSSREAVNTNFYILWFELSGNRTLVYYFSIILYCNYIYSPSCLGQETAKGPFGLSSQAAPCSPVYHTWWRLHTVPLIAERQAGKLWIPIFIVFGLTRLGIEPKSTVSVADALSTTWPRYSRLFSFSDYFVFKHKWQDNREFACLIWTEIIFVLSRLQSLLKDKPSDFQTLVACHLLCPDCRCRPNCNVPQLHAKPCQTTKRHQLQINSQQSLFDTVLKLMKRGNQNHQKELPRNSKMWHWHIRVLFISSLVENSELWPHLVTRKAFILEHLIWGKGRLGWLDALVFSLIFSQPCSNFGKNIVRVGVEDTRLDAKAKNTKKIRGQGLLFRGHKCSRPNTGASVLQTKKRS